MKYFRKLTGLSDGGEMHINIATISHFSAREDGGTTICAEDGTEFYVRELPAEIVIMLRSVGLHQSVSDVDNVKEQEHNTKSDFALRRAHEAIVGFRERITVLLESNTRMAKELEAAKAEK